MLRLFSCLSCHLLKLHGFEHLEFVRHVSWMLSNRHAGSSVDELAAEAWGAAQLLTSRWMWNPAPCHFSRNPMEVVVGNEEDGPRLHLVLAALAPLHVLPFVTRQPELL